LHFFVLLLFALADFTNRIENLFTAMWQQFTLMRHKPCVSQPPLELAFFHFSTFPRRPADERTLCEERGQ